MTKHEAASENQEPIDSRKIAVLDIGSNSFHLVVVKCSETRVETLNKLKQKVRLAEGLSDEDYLSEEAIRRGLEALKMFEKKIKDFAPDSVRIVATYTLRRAKNAHKFIKAARKIISYPVEIIFGQEEARLIYNAVAYTNSLEDSNLVIDIGGGSTEFALGNAKAPKVLRSLDMGCVSFTQRFFADGVLTEARFHQAITAARQQLAYIENNFTQIGWQQCLGTSGSIESMISMYCDDLEFCEHSLTLPQLENLKDYCLERGEIDRLELGEVNKLRTQVFPAGLAIMIAIFQSLRVDSLNYVTSALREGVIYEMDDVLRHHDIREGSVSTLASRYQVELEHAEQVAKTCFQLYEMAKDDWELQDLRVKPLLGWAAQLHEIGLYVQSRGVQKHSYYILKHADLHGFNAEQQAFMAMLTRFYRKKIQLADIPELTQFRQIELLQCLILLRMSAILNVRRNPQLAPNVELDVDDHSISLTFPTGWLKQHTVTAANLKNESEYLLDIGFKLSFQ